MSEEKIGPQYSADSIQALEGMEHVRMRPSMYIGDVGSRGLHHLVYEVVDNSIDEALAGHCDTISVIINDDNSITTEDNGRGIPVGLHKKEGVSALEVVCSILKRRGRLAVKERTGACIQLVMEMCTMWQQEHRQILGTGLTTFRGCYLCIAHLQKDCNIT